MEGGAVPVVLLFSLGHPPVAHFLLGFARQGAGAAGGVTLSARSPTQGRVSSPLSSPISGEGHDKPVSVVGTEQPRPLPDGC
jgi:hypothetical protein